MCPDAGLQHQLQPINCLGSLLLRNRQLVDEIGLGLCAVRLSIVGSDGGTGFKQLPAQGFTQIVFWETL